MIIFFNPDCSKCNAALDLLKGESCAVEIRDYLKNPPTPAELGSLIQKLGCKPFDIVRRSEPLYLEKFSASQFSDAEWLQILSENPILMERPIVVDGEKAIIGRPPVKVLDLMKSK